MAELHKYGYLCVIITNQRCIARSIITKETLKNIHNKMCQEIQSHGGSIFDIQVCPHEDKDHCLCRKPKAGLISQAIEKLTAQGYKLDLDNCYVVGDSENDIKAGHTAGIQTIKIGKASALADFNAQDLRDAWSTIQKTKRN